MIVTIRMGVFEKKTFYEGENYIDYDQWIIDLS